MRLALITTALAAVSMTVAACGSGANDAGPERKSAAGEVLGGEVTDDMLPLDTVRSVSPPGRSGPVEGDGLEAQPGRENGEGALPEPQVSNGPEPLVPVPPGVDPVDGPPAPPQ